MKKTMPRVAFPYQAADGGICAKYLYALGGYHSLEGGCPGWGSNDPRRIRFIGDRAGDLVIRYADGTQTRVPLIFGYTLWYRAIWLERPAPFFSDGADPTLTALLRACLYVKGAFEGEDPGVLRIELKDVPVLSVLVEPSPDKEGTPVYLGGFFDNGASDMADIDRQTVSPADPFFTAHTVRLDDPVPEACREAIDRLCRALHTVSEDLDSAPEVFTYPAGASGARLHFSGSRLAEIASGCVYHNMENLLARTDADGFIHTSYKGAPSWRYDGFGPYVVNANSYHNCFYSRDGARAIMTLNGFGYTEAAEAGCLFGNRLMMYYPEQGLTLAGVPVPGHFSVIPNKPLEYSKILTKIAAWPTRYTEERFGADYESLGNQETDGHGLMMMANYTVWCNLGKSPAWVNEHRAYIYEAARWILWCFEHPALSFAENGLLYGETEAAMNDYTLYANVPCCLGLLGYAEMAESIGDTASASAWRECAATIREGINARMVRDGKWDMRYTGFYHDPVVTMMADFYGYDTADMPADWPAYSRAAYAEDIQDIRSHGYVGATGLGYDHCMITQNALLLDMTADATRLVESLAKLSYAPRLPEPYLVPEGISYDAARGIYRRQGDLGNLVQLAEAMKCYLIVAGVSPLRENTLKLLPRLPAGWTLEMTDFPVQNGDLTVDVHTAYPVGGKQSATVSLRGDTAGISLQFRFGPFSDADTPELYLNGRRVSGEAVRSGDARWVTVTLPASAPAE